MPRKKMCLIVFFEHPSVVFLIWATWINKSAHWSFSSALGPMSRKQKSIKALLLPNESGVYILCFWYPAFMGHVLQRRVMCKLFLGDIWYELHHFLREVFGSYNTHHSILVFCSNVRAMQLADGHLGSYKRIQHSDWASRQKWGFSQIQWKGGFQQERARWTGNNPICLSSEVQAGSESSAKVGDKNN